MSPLPSLPDRILAERETLHRRRNHRPLIGKKSTGGDARASTSLAFADPRRLCADLDPGAHRLGLGVVVEHLVAHFASPAGLLVTAEGERCVENVIAVNPHGSSGDLVGHAVGFADVARPNAGS